MTKGYLREHAVEAYHNRGPRTLESVAVEFGLTSNQLTYFLRRAKKMSEAEKPKAEAGRSRAKAASLGTKGEAGVVDALFDARPQTKKGRKMVDPTDEVSSKSRGPLQQPNAVPLAESAALLIATAREVHRLREEVDTLREALGPLVAWSNRS